MVYKQEKLTSPSSGAQKYEIRVPTWLKEEPLPGRRLLVVSLHDGGVREMSRSSFIRALISLMRALPLGPNHSLKADLHHIGFNVTKYEFGRKYTFGP